MFCKTVHVYTLYCNYSNIKPSKNGGEKSQAVLVFGNKIPISDIYISDICM